MTAPTNVDEIRASLVSGIESLADAEYSGNHAAAVASILYALPADVRLHAVNSIAATGNGTTGPYDAIVRLAGIEYRIVKAGDTGRVTVTREAINLTDVEGTVAKTTTYGPQERESVAKAFEVVALNAGRTARDLAEQATVKHTPPAEKERVQRSGNSAAAKVDAMAAQMAQVQEMLAALVAANAPAAS